MSSGKQPIYRIALPWTGGDAKMYERIHNAAVFSGMEVYVSHEEMLAAGRDLTKYRYYVCSMADVWRGAKTLTDKQLMDRIRTLMEGMR